MIKNFFITHPIHKKIVKYFDIFFLLRPTLYFSVWVMIAIGMYSAQRYLYIYPIWISDLSYKTLFLFLGITLVCSSTFILNQIEDIKSDKINGKLFLVGKYFEAEKALFISKILLYLGLLISFFASFFVIFFAISIYYIWGILYSSKPYNWKKKPVLGWISNILIGKILFMIGWCFTLYNSNINVSYYNFQLLIIILPYLLSFSAVSLLSMLPDVKGDLINGDQTFPIVYGKKTTKSISLFLVLFAFAISLINIDPVASTSIITSIPFFLYCSFRQLPKDVLRAIRYPIFILNFFILVIYPWLFLPLIIIFYVSKYYYWHRFNLNYPTLLVDND